MKNTNYIAFVVLTIVGFMLLRVTLIVDHDMKHQNGVVRIERITDEGYVLSSGNVLPHNGSKLFVGDSLDVSYYKDKVLVGWLRYREVGEVGSIKY